MRRIWLFPILLLLCSGLWIAPVQAGGMLLSLPGQRPSHLGVKNGQLASCPSTPNCVSSQSPDPQHAIAPLLIRDDDAAQTWKALQTLVGQQPRAEVIRSDDHYLYAEFSSRLLGFVDDVEFYWPLQGQQIEVRSASRLGESDLGVNRQRVEQLRQSLVH
jgi:uncharacterized protein (DUF1499 family)